ncbi:adenosylcobinamide-GDP ribazoletransferase [Nereida sp. MMG025]|uniref:adenosylcobinamide-GDP ribazoletransferase n=1 Tax=Nereida sp. MMG025 TaxID=2909981 RepID=UPI001F481DF2|nr:adenosylcobinamide-GDP ribazoletransferase [Nereida sp. MMG025]MCF6445171.1 adenosylcobinamide-GDP ribazoletransferase [Nereida sp. MMG025]
MTNKSDMPLIDLRDIPASLGLLSRLPVRVDADHAMARSAASAWAYPVAGAIIGALAGGVAWLCLWLGLPAMISAGLTLGAAILITGALHEDGLADCADGFWGGYTVERRLAIMKDSQIGTYGVLALVLSVGLRWLALGSLLPDVNPILTLAAIGAISRATLPTIMHSVQNARSSGLSHQVGRPERNATLVALAIGALASFMLTPVAIAVMVIISLGCILLAKNKINGQTGDTLGATQQLIEVALLIFIVA